MVDPRSGRHRREREYRSVRSFPEIVDAVRENGGWLHVDGAFGLWAAAAPERRHLVDGVGLADSWTADAHKWLNVPYDAGIVIVRDRAAHHEAMTLGAAYYIETRGVERDSYNWVPESSRRARGFAVYAALRSLGRDGLADLIERSCGLARRMADALAGAPGVEILNDVVLNQVLVRFGGSDDLTADVVRRVQADGTCWLGGTRWQGIGAMGPRSPTGGRRRPMRTRRSRRSSDALARRASPDRDEPASRGRRWCAVMGGPT